MHPELLGGGVLDAVLFLLDVMVDLRRCLLGLPRLAQLANEVDGGDDTVILVEGVQRTITRKCEKDRLE